MFILVLGTRFIQKSHAIMTLVQIEIMKSETRKSSDSAFYLISFSIMVGFKVRALPHFTKLGWGCGCVFVGGVCV